MFATGDASEGLGEWRWLSKPCPTFPVDNMQVDAASGCITGNRPAVVENKSLSLMWCPPLPPHQLIVSAPTLGNKLNQSFQEQDEPSVLSLA